MNHLPPSPSNNIRVILIFFPPKIHGDISESRCTTGINDTAGKFATNVNDTDGKFAAGVNYTGGKDRGRLGHLGEWTDTVWINFFGSSGIHCVEKYVKKSYFGHQFIILMLYAL